MVDVLLAPYLRLRKGEIRIGTWVCTPADVLERGDTASDLAFEQSRGLLELYHRSRRVPDGYGVFFRRGGRRVGDTFSTKDIGILRRVLLVALLFGSRLAVDWLDVLECDDPQNNPGPFCNTHIDAQIARLAREEPVDPSRTTAFAATIDRELTNQAPLVPLFTPSLPDLTSARVGNYEDDNGTVLMDQLLGQVAHWPYSQGLNPAAS